MDDEGPCWRASGAGVLRSVRGDGPGSEPVRKSPAGAPPHTIMCMGVESFTEQNRCPLHVWTYISIVDVTVCNYSHSGHPTLDSIPRLSLRNAGKRLPSLFLLSRTPRLKNALFLVLSVSYARGTHVRVFLWGLELGQEVLVPQGYLAHKKTPDPPGPPCDPRQRPICTVAS